MLTTDRSSALDPGTTLSTDGGDLSVASARPTRTAGSSPSPGSDSREQADALRGLALRAPPLDDPSELWVHDMVGATVVTTGGDTVGRAWRWWPTPPPT